jgi:outer membrane biogenesis lipoprotein LolB
MKGGEKEEKDSQKKYFDMKWNKQSNTSSLLLSGPFSNPFHRLSIDRKTICHDPLAP